MPPQLTHDNRLDWEGDEGGDDDGDDDRDDV